MESAILSNDLEIQSLRELIKSLSSKSTVVDFEEKIQLARVKTNTRIWKQDDAIIGFAFVDNFNNLWFESIAQGPLLDQVETEMIAWGAACMKRFNTQTGENQTLDCSCHLDNWHRLDLLEKHGFVREQVRSLHYERSLEQPVMEQLLPKGFSIRCVRGRDEVEALVSLHRSAFGTTYMTVEERLAIMNAPNYVPEMDLVAVTADGDLAAFCICGFDDPQKTIGYTDPIGTHPTYQRLGLGKALISAGLIALKYAGAKTIRLGTSSDNLAMQNLAVKCGFVCVSETLWFSKMVS